jgi:hypothetical protein
VFSKRKDLTPCPALGAGRNDDPRKSSCTTKTQRTQRISMCCVEMVDHQPGKANHENNPLSFFVIFVPLWYELPNL